MGMNCKTCGLPYPAGNETWGYAGPMCRFGGDHTPRQIYAPMPHDAGSHDQHGCRPVRYMTEDDVRRIIREELSRSDNE